jgi:hypothetical protein
MIEYSQNNVLQGTGKQLGFPEFNLAIHLIGKSKLVAVNLASP